MLALVRTTGFWLMVMGFLTAAESFDEARDTFTLRGLGQRAVEAEVNVRRSFRPPPGELR
jgi:hypothetical protein